MSSNNLLELKVSDKNSSSSKDSKESDNRYMTVTHEWLTTPKQIYRGSLLYDNLHGSGIYFINKDEKIFYNGFFYANKLEGYCQVFYHKDGTHFQGLFKDNRRFGPGVLTYADESQDIGMWDGFSLVRVGKTNNTIPTLSMSNEGHIKILKYRHLVDVCPKHVPDIAEELLKNLGASTRVLEKSKELYSRDIKNKNNLFFNKKIYDSYYPEKVPTIDILIEEHLPQQSTRNDDIEPESEPDIENEDEGRKMKILSKKVDMLNDHLDDIRKTLSEIKEDIAIFTKNIDYCIKCCEVTEEVEEVQEKENEKIDKESEIIDSQSVFAISTNQTSSYSILSTLTSNIINTQELVETEHASEESGSIKKYIDNECVCLEEMGIEDVAEMEDKLKVLKKEELFYEQIHKHLILEIEKILRTMKCRKTIRTQKIVVTEILAWNNELLIVDMLKHSFLHRNTEHMVNFRVPAILSGHRQGFTKPGQQETICYEFFKECNTGTPIKVINYFREHKVNVNVTDAKGNSGLFYAVVNNKLEVIRVLVQFGANLNQINDDGLTPLSITLLNYLARKHYISNWECAFIPDTIVSIEDQQELKSWFPSRSFLSVTGTGTKASSFSVGKKTVQKISSHASLKAVLCIFSTKFPNYAPDEIKETLSCDDLVKLQNEQMKLSLALIENCIKTLIDFGSKPNYGDSPLPTFLISIYTENFNIVKTFLENGANANLVTPDENLNGLHILTSNKCTEENISISTLLIRYDCDPNTRTSGTHWPDQKLKLTVDAAYKDEIEDNGKNVLHILCMRTDFLSDNCGYFSKIASLLLHKVVVEATYLGLDSLRLAMLSGNLKLVDYLLRSGLFNPYKNVPHEGNVLTMLLSDRFQNILPLDVKKEIIEFLINNNVNPLTPFDQFDNVMDYINRKFKQNVDKAKDKSLNELEDLLKNYIFRNIFENIGIQVTNLLYDFAEDQKLDNEHLKPLLKYVTTAKCLENLKLLFNHGRIQSERFDKNLIREVMEYVSKDVQIRRVSRTNHTNHDVTLNNGRYLSLIEEIDFRKAISTEKKINLDPPGLDDQSKYLLCFECFSKTNIHSCPKCRFIHFCEKKCYLNSLKRKNNKHPCQVNMFVEEDPNDLENKAEYDILEEWKLVRASCKKRLDKLQKEVALKQKLEQSEKKPLNSKTKKEAKKSKIVLKTPTLITCIHKNNIAKDDLQVLSEKLHRYSNISEKRYASSGTKETAGSSNARKSRTGSNEIVPNLKDDKQISSEASLKDPLTPKKAEKGIKRDNSNATGRRDKSASCRFPCNMAVSDILSKYPETIVSSHFEPLPNLKEPYLIRKTRKVPAKPHFFMEILSKLFPDIHLSELLLPYTCYSDGGHLYYEFKNTNLFCRNYSIL